MPRATVLAVALLAAVAPLSGAPEWIRITSANFEIYTTASEREAKQTLETFEQVRYFFLREKSSGTTVGLPVTIVGFRNAKEYKPYRVNDVAAAYYTGDENRDVIVMSGLGVDQAPVAIHEYLHLLVRHSGFKMPLWLNEGFADVYSTLKPMGGQILLGSIPAGRAQGLNDGKWMPLAALFAVGHGSTEYNEKNRVGMFYGQSWLLTHMLMLSKTYRDGFPKFVDSVSDTGSAEKAFEAAYGKAPGQVEKDLQAYFRSTSLTGVLFKTRFEKIRIDPAKAATELEVGLTLAKLNGMLRRYDEAATQLNALAEANKAGYEVPEALGHLFWRKGDLESARRHLGAAVDLQPSNWKTYWDYARLVEGDSNEAVRYESALRKAIELNAGLTDARLRLGQHLYRKRSWSQALITLRGIKKIDAERAAPMFLMMAYAAMQVNLKDEAKRYAADAKKHARNPADTDSAYRLAAYLDQPAGDAPEVRETTVAAPAAESGSVDGPPELKRRPPAPNADAPVFQEPHYLTMRGQLSQLECLGKEARLHIAAADGAHLLLIRDPAAITILNSSAGSVELTCGPQNRNVAVDYLPRADARHKTTGDVASMEFLK